MSKKEKKALVPALRFPEFRDKEEWKERTLSDVLSEHKQKATGTEEVFSVSVHKGLVNQIEHLGRSFSASSTENYNRVLPGDIVYTKSPTGDFPLGIIKQSKLDFPVIVSPLYGVFSPETIALGTMLDAYFESPANVKFYLEPLVQKGAKNTININNTKFLSGTLILPLNKNEQQKIADCLTSIDELITSQTQKVDAFKAHKTGLLQQLFPVEGETIPKFRFPEFRNTGEWDEKELSQVCKINPSANDLPEKFVYIELESVEAGHLLQKNIISREGSPSRAQRLLKKGDIIFQTVRPYQKNNFFFLPSDDLDYVASTGYAQLRAYESNKYLFQYLHSDRFVERVLDKCTGTNYPAINSSALSEILVSVPKLEEQQKIADCLTSIDDLITAQTKKLDDFKSHKKGLMQQLFPAMDEVDA